MVVSKTGRSGALRFESRFQLLLHLLDLGARPRPELDDSSIRSILGWHQLKGLLTAFQVGNQPTLVNAILTPPFGVGDDVRAILHDGVQRSYTALVLAAMAKLDEESWHD
jgi:hypothetical protein